MKPVIKIVIGTRGSRLAVWQANSVKRRLEEIYTSMNVKIETIRTTGDNLPDSPLAGLGDKGIFTKEIESALIDKNIDIAVHSLKDLPTELPSGLTIGAITKRDYAEDVFISHPRKNYKYLKDIPERGRIATGSLRRKCQLLNLRPDIEIIDLRGNLDTRFAKLDESEWDGMILARCGVVRLGFADRITEILPVKKIIPAAGQGALCLQIREEDKTIKNYIRPLNCVPTMYSTLGERAFLRVMEGGCRIPAGAHGSIKNNDLTIEGMIGTIDGKKIIRGKVRGSPEQSGELGARLAIVLRECGGDEILKSIRISVNSRGYSSPVTEGG